MRLVPLAGEQPLAPWPAARRPSCRFQSAIRAAVPSSIQPLSRSAPIGDALIIVAHTAPAIFSSIAGGATTQPSRRPGNRLFDRLVTNTVRCGISGASGVRLRRQEPVDVVLDDDQAVLLGDGGDLPPTALGHHGGRRVLHPRHAVQHARASRRGRRPRARRGEALRRPSRRRASSGACCCASARAPEYVSSSISSVSPGLSSADERVVSPCCAPAVEHDVIGIDRHARAASARPPSPADAAVAASRRHSRASASTAARAAGTDAAARFATSLSGIRMLMLRSSSAVLAGRARRRPPARG